VIVRGASIIIGKDEHQPEMLYRLVISKAVLGQTKGEKAWIDVK